MDDTEKRYDLFVEKQMKQNYDSQDNQRQKIRRLLLQDNQSFLRKQMGDRSSQEVQDCRMHKTDMVFNTQLLKNVNHETPVLAERSRRKPF